MEEAESNPHFTGNRNSPDKNNTVLGTPSLPKLIKRNQRFQCILLLRLMRSLGIRPSYSLNHYLLDSCFVVSEETDIAHTIVSKQDSSSSWSHRTSNQVAKAKYTLIST